MERIEQLVMVGREFLGVNLMKHSILPLGEGLEELEMVRP